MSKGPLIVMSGPSGVGKTTLVDGLLAANKWPIRRAITATTRSARPGERPEVDYHFWTRERFEEAIRQGEMLEYACVHGKDYYGTPLSEVLPYRERGIGVILVIDVQGAEKVRGLYPTDHLSVFLVPPNEQELETRLRGRNEAEESIRRRLKTAKDELARQHEFHHVVVNDVLPATMARLEEILKHRFL